MILNHMYRYDVSKYGDVFRSIVVIPELTLNTKEIYFSVAIKVYLENTS